MNDWRHLNLGRLQVIWWPRRCFFATWQWPMLPSHPDVLPMFRSIVVWPLEFRWWYKPSYARLRGPEHLP